MGCRQPGRDKKSPEVEKLEKFESSLGFACQSPTFYEGVLARAGKSQSFDSIFDIFQRFSYISLNSNLQTLLKQRFEGEDRLKNFKCFCIILSNGTEIEKGESLWYAFDEGLNDCLGLNELKKLVRILVATAVDVVVEDWVGQKPVESLEKWRNYLRDRKESLENRLVKHFSQGKEVMSKDEFMLRLQDKPEGQIVKVVDLISQLERTQVIPTKFANPFKNMKVTSLTK